MKINSKQFHLKTDKLLLKKLNNTITYLNPERLASDVQAGSNQRAHPYKKSFPAIPSENTNPSAKKTSTVSILKEGG